MKIRFIKIIIFIFLNSFSIDSVNFNKINIFGDSHASFCFCKPENCWSSQGPYTININNIEVNAHFATHHLGPKTMHRVGRDGINFINIKNYGVQDGDTAVFAFGEIDARCHIGKQRDQYNRDSDEVIDTLVTKYIETIIINKNMFEKINVFVLSIMPPTDQSYNADSPKYGSLQDRVNITQKLNLKLKELCISNKIYFLDIYKFFSNADGFLNKSMSDGSVHANPNCSYIAKNQLLQMLLEIENQLL